MKTDIGRSLVPALVLALVTGCSAPDPADWVREHASPLDGDLEPLRAIVGDARIVALGDATYGTHETYLAKRRIVEFLVTQMGFSALAIEASMTDVPPIDALVRTGTGDPKAALASLRSWVWNTEEILGLVERLRELRATGQRSAVVTGIDLQLPRQSLLVVRDFFARTEPGYVAEFQRELDQVYAAILGVVRPQAQGSARPALGPSLDVARRVLARVEGQRDHLPNSVTPAGFDWAVQNARLVVQLLEMLSAGDVREAERLPVAAMHPVKAARDRSMAQNVIWILDHASSETKLVLWAHNLHVSRREGWMGQHLAQQYGPALRVIGFAFASGQYRAGREVHDAVAPPAGSVEEVLHRTGLPAFVVDLRSVPRDGSASWATEARPFRAIGPVATEEQFVPTVVADEYDALVYFDRTTPTVQVVN
jgi:erythromycin esterase